jgi:hypothetical protein
MTHPNDDYRNETADSLAAQDEVQDLEARMPAAIREKLIAAIANPNLVPRPPRPVPLQDDTDARRWAREFIERARASTFDPLDETAATSWFANAIEAGRSAGQRDRPSEIAAHRMPPATGDVVVPHEAVIGSGPAGPMWLNVQQRERFMLSGVETDLVSDGFHTFGELYVQRAHLLALATALTMMRTSRSRLHEDGTMFEGMFWVGTMSPVDQRPVTFHIDEKHWQLFDHAETLDNAPPFAGESSADVMLYIKQWIFWLQTWGPTRAQRGKYLMADKMQAKDVEDALWTLVERFDGDGRYGDPSPAQRALDETVKGIARNAIRELPGELTG